MAIFDLELKEVIAQDEEEFGDLEEGGGEEDGGGGDEEDYGDEDENLEY